MDNAQEKLSKNDALLKELFKSAVASAEMSSAENSEADLFLEQVLLKVQKVEKQKSYYQMLPGFLLAFVFVISLPPNISTIANLISVAMESAVQPYFAELSSNSLLQQSSGDSIPTLLLCLLLVIGVPFLVEKIQA